MVKEDLPDLKFDPYAQHEEIYDGGYMVDWVRCSCGWRSNSYWDGDDLAHDEWVKHEHGIHVYVLEGTGYDCMCRVDCEETFKSVEIRRLEKRLEELR